MTTQNDAEHDARTAISQLVDEEGKLAAVNLVDDMKRELMADGDVETPEPAATDGGQVAVEETEFTHTFDDDERRLLTEEDGVLVDADGNNARQKLQGTVELDTIEDDQMVLTGDTYDAKGHIKAVDYQSREFDGDRKVWLVDTDRVDELHRHLNGGGFLFVDGREAAEDEEAEVPVEEVLDDFVDMVDEGDRIRITYAQKNGNGYNDKEGTVRRIDLPDEEFVDATQLVFKRDDGQVMYVDVDYEYGTNLRLRTSMSHAPFVGDVAWMEVLD